MILKFLILSVLLVASECQVKYDNYALYKITPRNEEEVKYINDLVEMDRGFDFWMPPTVANNFVSVVSPPELREELEHSMKKRSIKTEITMENIQEAFDAQLYSRKRRDTSGRLYWTGYQTSDDILDWFEELERANPDVVTVVTGGRSFQGRNITGVKISRQSGFQSRRAFVIEAGQIGADWLSPVVATYIVNQLVNGEDDEARQASNDFDWYIFPVTNPDGFEYSQDYERLWYKNRRQITLNAIGTDLTRNWNSHWGVNGASTNAANNNFAGLGPFSEPETRSLSRYIESINQTIAGFLSFRSFGQRLVVPFAHTSDPLYNFQEMVTVGRRAMGSLAVKYNTHYIVGNSLSVSDGSTGTIVDWAKYRFNPPIAATYLLRDDGTWGYILPANQVEPTCEETFDSLMAILREARFINVL